MQLNPLQKMFIKGDFSALDDKNDYGFVSEEINIIKALDKSAN